MFKRLSIPLAIPLALGSAGMAQTAAAAEQGHWVATFEFGTALLPHGKFQSHATGNVANMSSLSPSLPTGAGSVQLETLSFDDAFRVGPSAALELGYALTSKLEPFVRLNYTQFRGQGIRVGTIHSPALQPPATVHTEFDDLESWSLDVGTRYFMLDSGPVRPYFAGYLGVDRSDSLDAHVRVNGTSVESGNNQLLDNETRFNAGVQLGFDYDFAEHASVRFSVGADYKTSRHEGSSVYEALGIDHVRIQDQTWSLPIDLGVSYRF